MEAQFYLVLPFLLRWVTRVRLGGFGAFGVVILGGMALRAVLGGWHLVNGEVEPPAFQTLIYYATWTRRRWAWGWRRWRVSGRGRGNG